jgi:hypothetical protein
MVEADDDTTIKIADFGFAKKVRDTESFKIPFTCPTEMFRKHN